MFRGRRCTRNHFTFFHFSPKRKSLSLATFSSVLAFPQHLSTIGFLFLGPAVSTFLAFSSIFQYLTITGQGLQAFTFSILFFLRRLPRWKYSPSYFPGRRSSDFGDAKAVPICAFLADSRCSFRISRPSPPPWAKPPNWTQTTPLVFPSPLPRFDLRTSSARSHYGLSNLRVSFRLLLWPCLPMPRPRLPAFVPSPSPREPYDLACAPTRDVVDCAAARCFPLPLLSRQPPNRPAILPPGC